MVRGLKSPAAKRFSLEKRLREENMMLIINFILYSKTHL